MREGGRWGGWEERERLIGTMSKEEVKDGTGRARERARAHTHTHTPQIHCTPHTCTRALAHTNTRARTNMQQDLQDGRRRAG